LETQLVTLLAPFSHKFPASPGFKSYLQHASCPKYCFLLVAAGPTVFPLPTIEHLLGPLLLSRQGSSCHQPEAMEGPCAGAGAACGHGSILHPCPGDPAAARKRPGGRRGAADGTPTWEGAKCVLGAASCPAVWWEGLSSQALWWDRGFGLPAAGQGWVVGLVAGSYPHHGENSKAVCPLPASSSESQRVGSDHRPQGLE